MKKFYEDSLVTIYHGDCQGIIHQIGHYDCVITDPPYGIEGGRGGSSKARGKSNYSSDFQDNREYIKNVVVPTLFDFAKWKTMALTPGFSNIHLYPPAESFGVFYCPAACGRQRFGFADSNPILYYGWHHLQGKGAKQCSLQVTEQPEKNGHPCPKPEKAWAWLVNKVATKEMVVLDPFMGSGTTQRVCKNLGIKSIGIEMNEAYCEIAAKRMSQEVLIF
jgi:site-specific DNA-methyltransferase (adenine-specific)